MADKKISQLTQAITPLSGGELVPIVQNGETVKVDVSDLRADTSEFVKDSDLADVATSGDYNDLENLPTIPATDNFVEKTGDTMTGALNITKTFTALTLPTGNAVINNTNIGRTPFPNYASFSHKDLSLSTNYALIQSPAGATIFNCADTQFIDFRIGNNRKVIINEFGDVGINTTNPQAKLDNNGDLRTNSLLEKSKNGSVSGGSYFLIWDSYGNHDIILTQNTEILQGDIPPVGYSQVITLNVIGDFALTLPTEWVIKNGGTYDGINGSQIVVQSWDNGNFYTVIN